MKKALFFFLAFTSLSATAQTAQVLPATHKTPPAHKSNIRLIPEAGVNFANYAVTSNGNNVATSTLAGLRAGATVEFSFSKHFFFQPGALYMRNGCDFPEYPISSMKVSTLNIPLNVIYKFRGINSNSFFIGAGPYIAFNLGGKVATAHPVMTGSPFSESSKISIGSSETDDLKFMDFGLNVHMGYEFKMGLLLKTGYQAGIANLNPSTTDDTRVHTANFYIVLGYALGK